MIVIEQAIYGEKQGITSGHDLLAASEEKNELFKRFSGYTDLADRPEGGVLQASVVRGLFVEDHFLLIKTFPDSEMLRSGRVFAHTLFIKKEDLSKLKGIADLFRFHLSSIDKEADMASIEYTPIDIEPSSSMPGKPEMAAVNALLANQRVVWLSEEGYWEWLERIWIRIPIETKMKLRIGAAFNPQRLKTDAINILFVPGDSKSLWAKHSIEVIDSTSIDSHQSAAANWLVGSGTKESEFQQLLDDFSPKINSLSLLKSLQDYGKVYHTLDQAPKLGPMLAFANFITLVNFNAGSGLKGKGRLLTAIINAIPQATVTQITALIHQTWKGFPNAIEKVSDALKHWLTNNLFSKGKAQESGGIVMKALQSDKSNWWTETILSYIQERLKKWQIADAPIIWHWIIEKPELAARHAHWLPENVETDLAKALPELKKPVADLVLKMAKEKHWLLIHAKTVIQVHSPIQATDAQLEIDTDNNHFIALSALSDVIKEKQFVQIAADRNDQRLHEIAGKKIANNARLVMSIDILKLGGQICWGASIKHGGALWVGFKAPEKELFKILDHLISGNDFDGNLLATIGESDVNDLTHYPKRSQIWAAIPENARQSFLSSTSKSILNAYLLGSVTVDEIERPISEMITSDSFQSQFLNEKKADLESVLKLYDGFTGLNDGFLADYITYYSKHISADEATRLGTLVKSNGFKNSAKRIYDKSRLNDSFKPAYEECSSLVDHGLFDFLKRKQSNYSETKNENFSMSDILIITATDTETSAVLEKAKEKFSREAEVSMKGEHAVSFLGVMNAFRIWHAQCEAGSGGPAGSQAIATDLIVEFDPKYVLMPGIAFGLNQKKEKIGDILVSTHVRSYEKQRIGKKKRINRGEKVPASSSLVSALRTVKQKWKKADMHFGIILSGEKLVDNPKFVDQLKRIEPESIGGEMEGAGLYAAAHRKKVDWILFKSIVDWGMGKTDEHQSDSSNYASEVLFEALEVITK
ncbi:hypothetical protein [Roseivirga sp.]|uniref:GAP1-N1 domain-containing protein n=1 Tax=Roseivirga sp. TaxID=1964215 RepID=UPI003B8B71F5